MDLVFGDVSTDNQEATERVLSERSGVSQRLRGRGTVEVAENRSGALKGIEELKLLASVFKGQKEGLTHNTCSLVESIYQRDGYRSGCDGRAFDIVGHSGVLGSRGVLVVKVEQRFVEVKVFFGIFVEVLGDV
ncbi:hypothetical protein BMS3Bbin02_01168 [bacterium BMS3Bbin02]|nr:hypothetical protein BMS3Bbin02_01168 [bacterium BMS3Bbin02]